MNELKRIIEQTNMWRELSNERRDDGKQQSLINVRRPVKEDCKTLFASIAMKLSPENLYCDGEISATKARAKAVVLNEAWTQLEGIFGRRVDEDEAFYW